MSETAWSRRRLLRLATAGGGMLLLPRRGRAGPDQGIGGTGAQLRPVDEESDRGIGGTGVIGTIRKFGSIFVNDLRIAYPADVAVFVDGQAAAASALKIGQVVRVVATRDGDGLATQTIDVSSEVVGRVERVGTKSLTVQGQAVSTAAIGSAGRYTVGDHVAVSGLRRIDGTIVASLIESRADGFTKVVGPVAQSSDGGLRIGGLRITGIDGALIGQRVIVIGQADGGALAASRSTRETALFPNAVQRLSVEAYVERRGNALRLGSGLPVEGAAAGLPQGRVVRAVLETSIGADGRLAVASLRSGGTRYQAAPRAGRGPQPETSPRPMDFHAPGNGANSPRDTNERGGPGLGGQGGPGFGGPGLGGFGQPGGGGPGGPSGRFGGGRR